MNTIAPETATDTTTGRESGMTLLDAYRALRQRAGERTQRVVPPVAGHRDDADPERRVWGAHFRQYD